MKNAYPDTTISGREPVDFGISAKQKALLFLRMSRPDQLLAVILVYTWGSQIARAGGSLWPPTTWLVGLLPLLLVSASIHYANEFADHETDALTVRTLFSGGSGALSTYCAPPLWALRAAWITLAAGLVVSMGAAMAGTLPIIALILLSVGAAGGWMYSLKPLALAWHGWGEVDNALLGGVLLPVYGFAVQAGTINLPIILLVLPFGLHVFVNLLATTWPDRHADRQVGKRTLATRWPVWQLRSLYFIAIGTAYGLVFLYHNRLMPGPIAWLTFLLLPLAIWAGRSYTRWHSPLPSVMVMVLYALLQLAAWSFLGDSISP